MPCVMEITEVFYQLVNIYDSNNNYPVFVIGSLDPYLRHLQSNL
jgi:hypothetical protein